MGREFDGQGAINMLIFYCNRCNEMITGGDYESTDQIVDRLDEHIKKCPPATFTFEREQRVLLRRDLTLYDHSMGVSAVRVRYGYTDREKQSDLLRLNVRRVQSRLVGLSRRSSGFIRPVSARHGRIEDCWTVEKGAMPQDLLSCVLFVTTPTTRTFSSWCRVGGQA